MRAMVGAAMFVLVASACSAISVDVPKKRPAPPKLLECSYKLPIIDSAFSVGLAGGAVIANAEAYQGGTVDFHAFTVGAFVTFAVITALSATYGFVEERRCYRLPDPG
jgi:hypothetical protein